MCVLLPARKLDPTPESLPAGLLPFVWNRGAVAKWLWVMRVGDSPPQGQSGFSWSHIHAYSCMWLVFYSHCHIREVYKEVIETQLMWLKRWKTFTVSMEGKGKIWLLVRKWEWWLRSAGSKYKQVNVAISLTLAITTKHYKIECLLFLFSCIKINGKSWSISKSHYLPQGNEMVIVCLFIVISNCSCVC